LTNVARHSGARQAAVDVTTRDDLVVLTVTDDGHGLPTARGTVPGAGLGLLSMRERAMELGGSCSVESSPGLGTTVRALVPLATSPSR
jgi:signal transduction histidine kinase